MLEVIAYPWHNRCNIIGFLLLNTSLKFEFYGLSDVGLVREHNEDAWKVLSERGVSILADGMGGHNAGEIAAQTAVDTLTELLLTTSSPMNEAFEKVNHLIYQMGEETPSLSGMGTTLIALELQEGGQAIRTHVGDSRLYLFRDGQIRALTRDHSLVNELVDLGTISLEEVEIFPYKHVLTKAIGTNPKVKPESHFFTYLPGDVYLLCSDGLTNYATDRELETAMRQMDSLKEGASNLIEIAKRNGGGDNVTVILVRVYNP